MRRRSLVTLIVGALLAGLVALSTGGADATPAGFDDSTYEAYGRVFPDPHGCVKGAPGKSPWAKGRICAVQFLQWNEALDGLKYLETRFPRYLQVINLRTQFGDLSELDGEELQSAGLPREDLTRDKRDLYVVKVTDLKSSVPEAERRHFAYSLSIHGIERAGIEGGIRAIEDLVTWAACEKDPDAAPACAAEGPFPKRILEPSNSGPTASSVVRNGVVYFVLSNPDGWHRGEWSEGGAFFQRYNGNGMDLNRDWPAVGYTEAQYTPGSEPETRGYGKFLKYVANRTSQKRFAGAIDLHGMLQARSFSFTLLGAGERDYRKNAITVDTAIKTFRDSEARLSWSPMIATAEDCPGDIEIPEDVQGGGNLPMCSDQWGTVWDTIDYQVTGSFGDWMDSPMGLDAVGIDNEMAFSHLAPNNAFQPDIEQLHVDGNKGLIYAQISSLLFEKPVSYSPTGRTAYIKDPRRIESRGRRAASPLEGLPTQDDVMGTEITGAQGFEFDVKGPSDGFYNGGLTVEATFTNARAVSGASGAGIVSIPLVLERFGSEHAGDPEEWTEVAHYFNQSPLYQQAGARIDLNDPKPGRYRMRPNQARLGPTSYHVTFSGGQAVQVPPQAPFDASPMDFFTDLNKYTPAEKQLTPVTVNQILADPTVLNGFDSVVVAGHFMPRFGAYSTAEQKAYTAALAGFARNGGNLVLTDGALAGLAKLDTGLARDNVGNGVFFAGWMDFADEQGETYARHPLAKGVNKEGTAEGSATLGDETFEHRHQTYEPVPLGYYVSQSGANNADCTGDRCDSPNWIVDQDAWEAAGGSVAARTLVKASEDPNDDNTRTGVSLGELRFGKGRIRIGGALFAPPTTKNYHPFGLESYALTYTGYQVFENLVRYQRAS